MRHCNEKPLKCLKERDTMIIFLPRKKDSDCCRENGVDVDRMVGRVLR